VGLAGGQNVNHGRDVSFVANDVLLRPSSVPGAQVLVYWVINNMTMTREQPPRACIEGGSRLGFSVFRSLNRMFLCEICCDCCQNFWASRRMYTDDCAVQIRGMVIIKAYQRLAPNLATLAQAFSYHHTPN
jgi:hypothetical protein